MRLAKVPAAPTSLTRNDAFGLRVCPIYLNRFTKIAQRCLPTLRGNENHDVFGRCPKNRGRTIRADASRQSSTPPGE
jgi:hypothetical protein